MQSEGLKLTPKKVKPHHENCCKQRRRVAKYHYKHQDQDQRVLQHSSQLYENGCKNKPDIEDTTDVKRVKRSFLPSESKKMAENTTPPTKKLISDEQVWREGDF